MVGPGSSGAIPFPEEILAPCLAVKHLQGLASSSPIFIHLLQKGGYPSDQGMVAQPVPSPHRVLTKAFSFPQIPWTLKKSSWSCRRRRTS